MWKIFHGANIGILRLHSIRHFRLISLKTAEFVSPTPGQKFIVPDLRTRLTTSTIVIVVNVRKNGTNHFFILRIELGDVTNQASVKTYICLVKLCNYNMISSTKQKVVEQFNLPSKQNTTF